jgi:predicted transposase YbfD/YdcC
MPDPRHHNIRHKLTDILTIGLFGVICGADGWVDVARYGRSKEPWLKTFLDLPHGIPSHDTFGDVFARLDPDALERCFRDWMATLLERCFRDWMATLVELSSGKLVAIDGKSLRRSFGHGWDKSGMAHLVSAFVEANHVVFAQVKTEGKGRELDAIHKLLGVLDLNGAVVTIDALGCRKDIARQILDAGGNYLLQVKENQETLYRRLRVELDDAVRDDFRGLGHDVYSATDAGHGRVEVRTLWVCWDVRPLLGDFADGWPGLRALAVVERTRDVGGTVSTERHYYIASLDRRTKAGRLAYLVRGHWGVENNLHWQLDVSFHEDQRRIRKGHGAENFSRLCRMSLNQLKREATAKVGIAAKRKMCGWDNDYLLKVLAA